MPDATPARTTAPDGKANGYLFQDAIGAELLLASLSDASMRIAFENQSHDNDMFDDLIVERNGVTVRLQCKNGPDFRPTDAIWRSGGGRGIKWAGLCASIEDSLANGGGSERYVLLTSFRAPEDLETAWLKKGSLRTMAGREYMCYVRNSPLDDEAIEIVAKLEVVFRAEHHNAGAENPREEENRRSIRDSPWWAKAIDCVKRSPPLIDNPHLAQSDKVLTAALNASNRFRAAKRLQVTGDDAARAMHIAAGSFQLQQGPPTEEFAIIEPLWTTDVHASINKPGSRTWLTGPPGSGKSTAIQHLPNEDEPITYRLYRPGDSPDEVRTRLQPAIFRHELAGSLDRQYAETIPIGLKADSSMRAISERLEAIAASISEDRLGPLVVFDGLDHDFRDGNQGKLVRNLLEIPFPPSFRVLVLSRPLEGMDDLQGFNQISLPSWQEQDIEEWLRANGQSYDDSVVAKLETASGGSPLLLSMMLRRATATEAELDSVAAQFFETRGVLDDFLSQLVAETRPTVHDALALLVVHIYPMKTNELRMIIGLPSVANDVFAGHGLQSICWVTEEGIELPHAYLGQFIKQQAEFDIEWRSALQAAQQRMLQFAAERFETAALDGEMLFRLLETDDEIREITRGIGPETLIRWAMEGVHEETARDGLRTIFRLGAKIVDPFIMMKAALLADRVQNLFEIETSAPQRLHYFAARGDKAAGERLAYQLIDQDDRNGMDAAESILQAMHYLHEQGLEIQTMDDVKALHDELRSPYNNGGLSTEQSLTARARWASPGEFWDFAGKVVEQLDGSLGIKITCLRSAPRDAKGFIIGPDEPPNWLMSNRGHAVRACAWLLATMPMRWIDRIQEIASNHDPVSLADRFAVSLFAPWRRAEMAEHEPGQLTIPHYDPHADEPPHSDAFYLGAIAAWAGEGADQIHNRLIGNVGKDGTGVHLFLAAIGAWLAKPDEAWGMKAFHDSLTFLARYGTAANTLITRSLDRSGCASMAYMVSVIGPDELTFGLPDDSSSLARSAGLPSIGTELERVMRIEVDQETAAHSILAKHGELLAMKPDEFGPCQDLVDLAIEAAELGHHELAGKCFADGLARGFRYGHRKDIFLIDVWEALLEVDPELYQESGLAIQLLNWSRHLHTVTDGKETRWFEGQIVAKLLDLHRMDLHTARDVADAPHTVDNLVNWSIDNETQYNREEWDAMLKAVRQSNQGWDDTKLSRLVRLAGQAFDRAEMELGVQLLHEIVDFHQPTSRVDEEDLQRFNELATLHEPGLVGRIEMREDTYTSETWTPRTRIAEQAVGGRLDSALVGASNDDLTQGFQDLWVSREQRHREHALTVLATLMERDPERGWLIAEGALLETSKMSRLWGSGFRILCGMLIKTDGERTLRAALEAWRNDSVQGRPFGYGALPNLCWIVHHVRGREAAIAILREAVAILSRSLEPHQHRVQVWGKIQESWMIRG